MNVGGVLRGRLTLARNRLLGGPRGRRGVGRSGLVAGVVMVGVTAILMAGFGALFARLAAEGAPAIETARVLAVLLSASMAAVLIFDAHETLAVVLLDRDLELLRRAPIRPAALLAIKLLDALPRTAGPLLLLALPAMAAFLVAHAAPWPAWLLLPPLLLAAWALPLAVGLPAGVLLLRIVPAQRAREALALLSSLALVVVWGGNALLAPRLAESEAADSLRVALSPLAALRTPADPATIALAAGAEGAWGRAAANAGAFTVVALAALAVSCAFVAWQLGGTLARVEVERLRRGGKAGAAPVRRRRGVIAALVARDAKLFRRDWTVASDVLTAALLWTLLPLVSLAGSAHEPGLLVRAMLLSLGVGLGYEIAGRALPIEREALAWSRRAPVGAARWVAGRLAGTAALSGALAATAGLVMAAAFRLPAAEWARIAALVLPAIGFALVLGLWTGAMWGDLRWTSPRAMLSTTGRLVASLLLLTQAIGWLGLGLLIEALGSPAGFGWWGPTVLAAAIGVPVFLATVRRLTELEWSY